MPRLPRKSSLRWRKWTVEMFLREPSIDAGPDDSLSSDANEESEEDPVYRVRLSILRAMYETLRVICQGSWSSSEDTSAVVSGTDDGDQDHELFLEAHSSFKTKSCLFDSQKSLQEWFDGVERLPDS